MAMPVGKPTSKAESVDLFGSLNKNGYATPIRHRPCGFLEQFKEIRR
jgi:hypothetical protein